MWKSAVRLGKRRRESGLNIRRKTNPKIGFGSLEIYICTVLL